LLPLAAPCCPWRCPAAFASFTSDDLKNSLRVLGNVTTTPSGRGTFGDPSGLSWGGIVWRQGLPFTYYGNSLCTPASWTSSFSFSVSDADTGGLLFFVTRDKFGRMQPTDVDSGPPGCGCPAELRSSVEFDNLENAEDGDVNSNHIGINVGPTLQSTVNSGADPTCAPPLIRAVYAWVDYSASDLAMSVSSQSGERPEAGCSQRGGGGSEHVLWDRGGLSVRCGVLRRARGVPLAHVRAALVDARVPG